MIPPRRHFVPLRNLTRKDGVDTYSIHQYRYAAEVVRGESLIWDRDYTDEEAMDVCIWLNSREKLLGE